MVTLQNNQTDKIVFNGAVEGLRIISSLAGETVNKTPSQPDYRNIMIEWKTDGRTTYSGDLQTLIQSMLLASRTASYTYKFLRTELGTVLVPASATEKLLAMADISFPCPVLVGLHEIQIRMGKVFKTGANEFDTSTSILFDFDVSDELAEYDWKLNLEPITKTSQKSFQYTGVVSDILVIESDAFCAVNPISFITSATVASSTGEQGIYKGNELSAQQVFPHNPEVGCKSLLITDKEFLAAPSVSLQFDTTKFGASTDYNLASIAIWKATNIGHNKSTML